MFKTELGINWYGLATFRLFYRFIVWYILFFKAQRITLRDVQCTQSDIKYMFRKKENNKESLGIYNTYLLNIGRVEYVFTTPYKWLRISSHIVSFASNSQHISLYIYMMSTARISYLLSSYWRLYNIHVCALSRNQHVISNACVIYWPYAI